LIAPTLTPLITSNQWPLSAIRCLQAPTCQLPLAPPPDRTNARRISPYTTPAPLGQHRPPAQSSRARCGGSPSIIFMAGAVIICVSTNFCSPDYRRSHRSTSPSTGRFPIDPVHNTPTNCSPFRIGSWLLTLRCRDRFDLTKGVKPSSWPGKNTTWRERSRVAHPPDYFAAPQRRTLPDSVRLGTNVECRNPKECRMTKPEAGPHIAFVLRPSDFFRVSSFVIRHSLLSFLARAGPLWLNPAICG